MSVRLTIKKRGEPGGADKAETVVLNEDVITIGRSETCDVRLAQTAVSREHARIFREDTLFFLQDLNSAYGTSINDTKVPKGEKRLLNNGDTILIAQFDVTFDRVAAVEEGEERTGHTRFISRNVIRNVMQGIASGEDPYLRVMNGPRDGQKIAIGAAHEYIVGRDETADIQLNDDLVSRRHVKIRRDWAGVSVEDLGSRNGLKVNKKKVKRVKLKDRDEVQIGNVKLLFIDPAEIRDAPVVMPADDENEGTHALPDEPEPEPAPAVVAREDDANVQVSPEASEPQPEEPAAEGSEASESDDPNQTGAETGEADEGALDEELNQYEGDGDGQEDDVAQSGSFEGRQKIIMFVVVGLSGVIGLVILALLLLGA